MKKIIVSDFDGTVNRFDIGNKITRSLLTSEEFKFIEKSYKSRKINNFEIYEKYLAPLISKDGHNLSEIINRYLCQTDGFIDFANFTKNKEYDLLILSDGFDIYISAFLEKYNLNIPFYANRIIKTESGYDVIFPNKTEDCEKCGTCKSEIIKNLNKKYEEIIYVGDGISDICPSDTVDVFFAKRSIFKEINNKNKFYFYNFS
ncbi:MAG: MtnX-like HAD-IB family phosphatase, partial [Proteobacteria bacterium]|nr:MtnX-like HAD-IB family phosphatase [Pseudomonadota bacterium]